MKKDPLDAILSAPAVIAPPIWSGQQSQALKQCQEWLENGGQQTFYLAGYAGTGKTTLARHLASHVAHPMFMAFTGKAASVLRKNGCPGATTIHRSIYHVPEKDEREQVRLAQELEVARAEVDERRIQEIREALYVERKKQELRFAVNPDAEVRDASLVVVDECSMVDQLLGRDLESFGVKILVLGDPGQLPPVKGTGYFTGRRPDICLTEIHRQAKDNPIIQMATTIREGGVVAPGHYGNSMKVPRADVETGYLAEVDQVLTGTNKVRRSLNQRIRKHLGFTADYPEEGEKLVCLRNNHDIGLLNGVICRADTTAEYDEMDDVLSLDISSDGIKLPALSVDREPFLAYQKGYEEKMSDAQLLGQRGGGDQFDWGYALTVHKAQGSQWPHVTLVDDRFGHWEPKMRRQWLYTAITRAQERVTWLA